MTLVIQVMMVLAALLASISSTAAQGHPTELWNPSDHVQLDLPLHELVVAAKTSATEATEAHKRLEVAMKDMPSGAALKTLSADLAKAASAASPQQAKRKLATPTSFTCESFAAFSPWSMCSDIVDYPFLMETSSSLAAMETAVRAMLPTASLGLIGNLCLDSLKRKVCADVYRPCVTGVVSGDSSTNDATTNLPMKLPCKSVCDAASSTGSTCSGLMEGLGVMVGGVCSDAAQYDPNAATCNAITGARLGTVSVAPHFEPYIGTACTGITATTYLGDTAAITEIPGLAPLLPPWVQQGLIELTTKPIFDATPRYLYEACSVEERKFFCSLKYMPPQTLTSLVAFFGPVYMPKFPSQALCQSYRKSCSPFIIDMAKALDMDCATEVAPNTPLFPVANVILGAVPDGSGGFIYLQTDVNDAPTVAGYKVGVQCPYGYSADEEKGRHVSDYSYMFQTGETANTVQDPYSPCKLMCPALAVDTADNYRTMQSNQAIAEFLVLPIVIVLVINMIFQEKEKRNTVVFIFALYMLFGVLLACIAFICTWASKDEFMKCDGPLVFEQGGSWFGKLVYVPHAISRSMSVYFAIYVNSCVTLEVWLRVFWQIKKIDTIKFAYTICLGLIVFAMWFTPFIYFHTHEVAGEPGKTAIVKYPYNIPYYNFPQGYPNDIFENAETIRFNMYLVPIFVYYFITTAITLHMLYYCISISLVALNKTGGDANPLTKLWNTYRALISFNIVFQAFALGILMFATAYEYVTPGFSREGYVQGLTAYVTCLIATFTSLDADPTGGTAKCGVSSDHKMTWINLQGFNFAIILPVILVAKITYNDAAGKIYWHYTPAPVQKFLNEYYFAQKVHVVGSMEMKHTLVSKEEDEGKSEI